MIRAQRSTGLIALGFSIFVSTLPANAQLIKSSKIDAGGSKTTAGIRRLWGISSPTSLAQVPSADLEKLSQNCENLIPTISRMSTSFPTTRRAT